MAIAASNVWEVRSGATVNNANGGGFNPANATPGTDWSQQLTAQYTFTDIVISGSTVTSALVPFTSDMVGNNLHITSGTGFTQGWYECVSLSGVVMTLDRSPGTTASTGGNGKIGGAMSMNSSTANQTDSSFLNGAVVAGNTVWFKNGSLTLGIATTGAAGTATAPIRWMGYNSTRGDITASGTTNNPTIATNALAFTTGTYTNVWNINFTGTGTAVLISGAHSTLTNCKGTNNSTTTGRGVFTTSATPTIWFRCEAISYRGIAFNGSSGLYLGCDGHDSDIGFKDATTNPMQILFCKAYCNVTAAISLGTNSNLNPQVVYGCTLYGSEAQTGTGILLTTGNSMVQAYGNTISGFVTGVSHADSANNTILDYNNFFNNGTDVSNVIKGSNDKALNPTFTTIAQFTGTAATTSGSVLTDGAQAFTGITVNRDFCYIISGTGVTVGQYMITGFTGTTLTLDIAPGTSAVADKHYQVTTGRNFGIGTNLKALAFPGVFPDGITTGYLDIGAVQRQESTATAGGPMIMVQ